MLEELKLEKNRVKADVGRDEAGENRVKAAVSSVEAG